MNTKTIAYLTAVTPQASPFIMREIREMRRRGWGIETLAIRRADVLYDDSSRDPPTWHILPPSWPRLLADHFAVLLSRPLRYLAALAFAVRRRPPGLRALLWHLFYFAEAVLLWRRLRGLRIDHVHVHFAMTAANVAMIASRLGDLTYSLTIHGSTEFFNVEKYQLARKADLARFVICISHFCRAQVLCCAPRAAGDKLHVVHCGVDVDAYAPVLKTHDGHALHLLTVGRLIPVKGLDTLLRAMAMLRRQDREVIWTVIGDGPERPALEALARELDLEQAVRFAGNVGQDRIQVYFDEADAYVQPSYAEGLPVVLMEAMAKEIPVVASRITGIPELVEDGESGLLVAPGDAQQLAQAIATLVDDPELRRQLGRNARQRVITDFNIHMIGAELNALFERAIVRDGPAPPTGAGDRWSAPPARQAIALVPREKSKGGASCEPRPNRP